MALVHLHRHSEFSLLDGVGTAEVYAKRAAELGQSALALTDHGSLAGILYHASACEDVGIKPILGMEAYFTSDALKHDKEHKRFHLVLLAKNEAGFKNLMRLSSLSHTPENFYYKPCIDWRLLRDYSEGLIASSSCLSGIIPRAILANDYEGARKYINTMQDIFGEDFYVEVQPHDDPGQRKVNIDIISMADQKGIPVVATNDVHFPHQDWYDTQDILLMIQTGQSNKSREQKEAEKLDSFMFSGNTYWLMSEDEINTQFAAFHPELRPDRVQEMIDNSEKIAERVEHFTIDRSPKIPKATKTPLEAERILRQWCKEGLERIGKEKEEQYLTRIEDEIRVIRKLKVLDYFVIVADMVRWAKDRGIRVGPGRGSAAGCLINYLVGITAIDPIGYGLLFERFLNEYRTSLPDIDVDFQADRRDEVKQYLHEKYGEEYVVNVSSFNSFKLKAAISDVARVLNVPFNEVKRATSAIPDNTFGASAERIENMYPAVKTFLEKYPDVRKHAFRLFEQVKGQSQHAGAVIITDRPAIDVIPMMRTKEGGMVSQWSERANAQLISPYGFLKIDCLSTDALTVQQRTLDKIKDKIDFESAEQFPVIESPYNSDPKVVEAFADGYNLGVHQFAGRGIIGLLKHIKPENLDHIIATNALYRPGTITNGVAFEYGDRKNGNTYWQIPHRAIEPYVEDTFGLMIYQEQVMQVFRALGLNVSPADTAPFLSVVAKGIARDLEGKKKLQGYYEQFAAGCELKKIPKRTYDEIWEQILQMTTYAFNKAHSAGYALQAYQDKFLKLYYPLEFYSSLLSVKMEATTDPQKKVMKVIREANTVGVKVLPPDINASDIEFTIDGNSIRFGLQAVKFVGQAAVEELQEKRPFESFDDFEERVTKRRLNKRVKESLYACGAFDSLGGRTDWSIEEKVVKEKELLGFSVSGAGNEEYRELLAQYVLGVDGDEAQIGGEIVAIKEVTDKHSNKMAFVDLEYNTEDYSTTFFSDTYEKYHHLLTEGNTIIVSGDYDSERESTTVKNAISIAQLAAEG